MEDFVEDYTRYVKKKSSDTKSQENNAALKLTILELQKKKELESRALKIVNFLIEGKLSPPVFLRCLKHINQRYYEDTVEERALSKLCGYPLCGNQLQDIPSNQYSIDLKHKKVYDMTERRKLCSINCYAANVHIKNQIDNSPLWSRNFEDCPTYTLKTSTENNIYKEEANLQDKASGKSPFVSVCSFTEISLSEMEDKPSTQYSNSLNKNKVETMSTIGEDEEVDEANNEAVNRENSSPEKDTLRNDNTINEAKSVKKKGKSKKTKSKKETPEEILNFIRNSIYEWITIETYIFLYGETKVQEIINKEQLQEQIQIAKKEVNNIDLKQKYHEICRKLQLSELIEEGYDNSFVGNDKLQPIPDYKLLKEEGKNLKLKVRSFYNGALHGVASKDSASSDSVKEENFVETSLQLPVLEPTSVNAIRLKIYSNVIGKSIIDLTQNLGLPSNYVMQDLQLLIKTFKLDAHNIIIKPAALTIIAIVLLQLLAVRDSKLNDELNSKKSKSYMSLLFKYVPRGETFINELLLDITDINRFFKNYLCLSNT